MRLGGGFFPARFLDCTTSPPRRLFLLNRIAAGVASLEDVVVVEAPAREEEVVDVEIDEGVVA